MLAQSAEQGKFTFIVFYRADDDATRGIMAQIVTETVAKRAGQAVPVFVQITNPAEQAIVKQFDVAGELPMPMTLATAPNGAITGVFPQRVAEAQLATAFVTPAMSHCMKSMQAGKLVFLCVQTTPQPTVPQAVNEFLADPQFKDRGDVVLVNAADPAEAQLLAELELGKTNSVFFRRRACWSASLDSRLPRRRSPEPCTKPVSAARIRTANTDTITPRSRPSPAFAKRRPFMLYQGRQI